MFRPYDHLQAETYTMEIISIDNGSVLKLVVCILLRVLGQVQGFRLTQHWFEYFIQ
jgi:hypothetical protein